MWQLILLAVFANSLCPLFGTVIYQGCNSDLESNSNEDYYIDEGCNLDPECYSNRGGCTDQGCRDYSGENDSDENYSDENVSNSNENDCEDGNGCGQVDCPYALERFNEAVLRSSTRILKIYSDKYPDETFCISPLAILYLAAGVGLFACGETKEEYYSLLNLRSRDEISCVLRTINERIRRLPKGVEFNIATDFFGNIQYPFTPRFSADILVGVGQNYDFSNSQKAADAINKQVASETKNRVTDIIDDLCILNRTTEIVTISATYFSSDWDIEFEISNRIKEFRVAPGKTLPARFYYQEAFYNYTHSSELCSKVIQLNFKNCIFDVVIVLPDVPFTEDKVLDIMANNPTEWLYKIKKQFKRKRVAVHIPVYKKVTSLDSRALFIELTNFKTIFRKDTIQLRGAIRGDKPASISAGRQKNNIRVPATGGRAPKLSKGEATKEFISDHPSLFVVCFGNTIVYVGKIVRPTEGQFAKN